MYWNNKGSFCQQFAYLFIRLIVCSGNQLAVVLCSAIVLLVQLFIAMPFMVFESHFLVQNLNKRQCLHMENNSFWKFKILRIFEMPVYL